MTDFDSKGQTAGAMLRHIRESHGASLEALSSTIKVSVAKLQALESDDRDALPDPNFNRALAMTVCRALKVDPTDVLAAMPAAVATVLTATKPALNEPYKDFADTGLTFDRSSHVRVSLPKVPAAAWGSMGLLLVAALIYWLPDRAEWPFLNEAQQAEPAAAIPLQPDVASAVPAPVASEPSSLPAAASLASSSAHASVALLPELPASAEATASGQTAAVTAPSAPAAGVTSPAVSSPSVLEKVGRLRLAAKDAAWVEVRDGAGAKIFSRHISAGESVELQGQPPLKVHAGNAPVLSIQFNGQAIDLAAVTRQNVARIELK